jgi:RNA polymerase sigma-70 factor (ECF subfamily)
MTAAPPDQSVFMHDVGPLIPALRAFAMTLTGGRSLSDDLVQETLIKAWTNWPRFEPGTNLRSWLFTILRNTFYSELRRHRNELSETDLGHEAALFQKPAHDGHLAMRDFLTALRQLPAHQREEVAGMTGVAVGTVKSRLSRARQRLQSLLQLDEGETITPAMDGASLAVMARSAERIA